MHRLCIEGGTLSASDVSDVKGFSEKEIRADLKDGRKLTVSGEKLKISLFNKQNGTLGVDGKVYALKYSSGENFIKKLIK